MQLPAMEDVDGAQVRVGRDEAVAEAELTTQRNALRLLGEDRVGSALEKEAVLLLGADDATERRAGLEKAVGDPALVQRPGSRQTRDAASDDRDRRACHKES